VERLTAPLELLRRFPKARLVFTGGATVELHGSTFTEVGMAKRFWRAIGFDQDNILYEDRASDTYENAVFTRALVKPTPGERWLLVTSVTHMPRSIGAFRQAGFPVIPYPVNYRTNGPPVEFKYAVEQVASPPTRRPGDTRMARASGLLADRQD
jgi:uncharacterized SAM-binding protein YcdF (DUF218 family)